MVGLVNCCERCCQSGRWPVRRQLQDRRHRGRRARGSRDHEQPTRGARGSSVPVLCLCVRHVVPNPRGLSHPFWNLDLSPNPSHLADSK